MCAGDIILQLIPTLALTPLNNRTNFFFKAELLHIVVKVRLSSGALSSFVRFGEERNLERVFIT